MAAYLHQPVPNEGLTGRDDRDGHRAPYDIPYEMLHSYARWKACIIVGYAQPDVTFDKVFTMASQKRLPKLTDLVNLKKKLISKR